MKLLILTILATLGFAFGMWAEGTAVTSLSTNEQAEVEQSLNAFEKGEIGLNEASGLPNNCDKIVAYYFLHTNDVSVKMKLPISRSFAIMGNYPEALKLAQEYVNVYSNDWHGWRVLGGANFEMHLYDQSISAYTNAARLGDEEIYTELGGAAWAADRVDILRDIVVPHLLISKDDVTRFSKQKRLEMRMILAGYSLRTDRQDIFIKALDGVDYQDVLNNESVKQLVKVGCERFKGKDIDKIRQQLDAASNSETKPPQ